ncbi:MAG: hypothetical protein Q9227_003827 [Pyrenula ochraceoflavens]
MSESDLFRVRKVLESGLSKQRDEAVVSITSLFFARDRLNKVQVSKSQETGCMPTRPSLTELPKDIINLIIDHLSDDEVSIVCLALTCRSLALVAEERRLKNPVKCANYGANVAKLFKLVDRDLRHRHDPCIRVCHMSTRFAETHEIQQKTVEKLRRFIPGALETYWQICRRCEKALEIEETGHPYTDEWHGAYFEFGSISPGPMFRIDVVEPCLDALKELLRVFDGIEKQRQQDLLDLEINDLWQMLLPTTARGQQIAMLNM